MNKQYYVSILGNDRPTLYMGMTSNLAKRIWEHKNEVVPGFTEKYHLHKLLYFESHNSADVAIIREKQLKKWKRDWKLSLIREMNPQLEDLSAKVFF